MLSANSEEAKLRSIFEEPGSIEHIPIGQIYKFMLEAKFHLDEETTIQKFGVEPCIIWSFFKDYMNLDGYIDFKIYSLCGIANTVEEFQKEWDEKVEKIIENSISTTKTTKKNIVIKPFDKMSFSDFHHAIKKIPFKHLGTNDVIVDFGTMKAIRSFLRRFTYSNAQKVERCLSIYALRKIPTATAQRLLGDEDYQNILSNQRVQKLYDEANKQSHKVYEECNKNRNMYPWFNPQMNQLQPQLDRVKQNENPQLPQYENPQFCQYQVETKLNLIFESKDYHHFPILVMFRHIKLSGNWLRATDKNNKINMPSDKIYDLFLNLFKLNSVELKNKKEEDIKKIWEDYYSKQLQENFDKRKIDLKNMSFSQFHRTLFKSSETETDFPGIGDILVVEAHLRNFTYSKISIDSKNSKVSKVGNMERCLSIFSLKRIQPKIAEKILGDDYNKPLSDTLVQSLYTGYENLLKQALDDYKNRLTVEKTIGELLPFVKDDAVSDEPNEKDKEKIAEMVAQWRKELNVPAPVPVADSSSQPEEKRGEKRKRDRNLAPSTGAAAPTVTTETENKYESQRKKQRRGQNTSS